MSSSSPFLWRICPRHFAPWLHCALWSMCPESSRAAANCSTPCIDTTSVSCKTCWLACVVRMHDGLQKSMNLGNNSSTHAFMYVFTLLLVMFMYVCVHVYMCLLYIYVCLYIYIYVCMYVYTWNTYIHATHILTTTSYWKLHTMWTHTQTYTRDQYIDSDVRCACTKTLCLFQNPLCIVCARVHTKTQGISTRILCMLVSVLQNKPCVLGRHGPITTMLGLVHTV